MCACVCARMWMVGGGNTGYYGKWLKIILPLAEFRFEIFMLSLGEILDI